MAAPGYARLLTEGVTLAAERFARSWSGPMYDADNVAFSRLCDRCGHGHVRHGIYRTIPDDPQPHPCRACELACPGYVAPTAAEREALATLLSRLRRPAG